MSSTCSISRIGGILKHDLHDLNKSLIIIRFFLSVRTDSHIRPEGRCLVE